MTHFSCHSYILANAANPFSARGAPRRSNARAGTNNLSSAKIRTVIKEVVANTVYRRCDGIATSYEVVVPRDRHVSPPTKRRFGGNPGLAARNDISLDWRVPEAIVFVGMSSARRVSVSTELKV